MSCKGQFLRPYVKGNVFDEMDALETGGRGNGFLFLFVDPYEVVSRSSKTRMAAAIPSWTSRFTLFRSRMGA